MKQCECGCGNNINSDKRFFYGHNRKGTVRSEATIERVKVTWQERKEEWRAALKAGSNKPSSKEAYSKAKTGIPLSEEQKIKIGLGNKGKVRTTEMRKRYSELNIGKRKGEENNLWKGGVSRSYKNGYYSPEYIQWRKSVFKRDNYTCQYCGLQDYITAHHVKSFSKYPELRFERNNGITLCEECHCKVDHYRARFKKKVLLNN